MLPLEVLSAETNVICWETGDSDVEGGLLGASICYTLDGKVKPASKGG